jgi:hypothetical protein
MDALVAVRLRATGYSRDQVEQGIRNEAPKLRPNEARDWNAYANRAVDHAFSVSGERHLREMLKTQDVLLKVEGRSRSQNLSLDGRLRRGLGFER